MGGDLTYANHMLVEKRNGFLKQKVYGAFDLRNSGDGY